MLRHYTNTAPPVQFSDHVNAGANLWPVSTTIGYPDPPFLLGAERGTANEEVVLCTDKAPDSFTVEPGYDGTTPVEHQPGASIEHCSASIEFREANAHINDPTQHVTVCTSTTRPTAPEIAQRIYETDTGRYYTWTGLGNAATGWLPAAGTLLAYEYYALGNTVPQYSDTTHGLGHPLPPHCQWIMPALPLPGGVPTFAPPYTAPYTHRIKIEFFARSAIFDSGSAQEVMLAMLQPASPLSFGGSFEHAVLIDQHAPWGPSYQNFIYVVAVVDNNRIPAGPAGAVVNLYSPTGRTGASSIYPDCPMWMAVSVV
jgi:hypothetical protein